MPELLEHTVVLHKSIQKANVLNKNMGYDEENSKGGGGFSKIWHIQKLHTLSTHTHHFIFKGVLCLMKKKLISNNNVTRFTRLQHVCYNNFPLRLYYS